MPLWMWISCLFLAATMTFVEAWVFKLDVLLPHMWLRKRRLRRVLRDYPVYDPPHKVEERLLTRELAMENFDYFMSVRHARVSYLQNWLRKYFRVSMTLDRKGVTKLNRWGNKYAGLLLDESHYPWRPGRLLRGGARVYDRMSNHSYFTYDPPWTVPNSGCNVLFDMGIALGEAIITQCPNLHWAFDKREEFFPRRAAVMKDQVGMSFQRPHIYGYDNPIYCEAPLHSIRSFAFQMCVNTVTLKDRVALMKRTSYSRRNLLNQLISEFDAALREYPDAGDPYYSPSEMSFSEYLALIDQNTVEEYKGYD